MIICDFHYCIYNKKSECILKIVCISSLGICDDCLIPNIDAETLDKYKKEMRKRLQPQTVKTKSKSENKKLL